MIIVTTNYSATPATWILRRCGGRASGPFSYCDRCGEGVETTGGECGRLVEARPPVETTSGGMTDLIGQLAQICLEPKGADDAD